MNKNAPGAAADAAVNEAAAIPALIETLHEIDQELTALTSGEIDAVSNRAGRTVLLQEAQERLRDYEAVKQSAILDALPAHIALLDSHGCISSVNTAWCRFALANGLLSPDGGLGLDYIEVCAAAVGTDAALAHQVAQAIRSVLAGELNTFSIEYACHSAATERWFLLTVSPLSDTAPTGAIVMHLDITERTRAELETRRTGELLRAVSAGTPDQVFVKGTDGRYLLCNEAFAQFAGRSMAELIGQDSAAIFGAEVAHQLTETDRLVIESGESISTDDDLLGVAGIRTFHVTKAPYRDASGAVIGVIGISRDVTERKNALSELKAAERATALLASRLTSTLESITEGFVTLDHDWRYTYVNSEALRMFGRAPESRNSLLGCVIWDEFPALVGSEFERVFRHAMEVGRGTTFEAFYPPWDAWIGAKCYPSETGLSINFSDVTQQRLDQNALRELNSDLEARVATRTAELKAARDEAEQANRAKSAFLASMSHEIRTPMNGVVGMIDVLEQSHLKPAQGEIVKTVRESAYALLRIVDDVLDFSKIEAGYMQIDNEPMSIEQVVEGVCDTLEHLSRGKGVSLLLFVDPGLPSEVVGDAMRLRQVLMNLAGNAIKFSSADGRAGEVHVRVNQLARQGQKVSIGFAVSDNGIGMDESTLARLFTPFTQADGSTTRRFGGTGLGLSISSRLATLMGGEIMVTSRLGHGSCFSLQLELVALNNNAGADLAATTRLGGLHCLVIGVPTGPAPDLATYLARAGAVLHQVSSLAAADAWFASAAPGRHVVIDARGGSAEAALLAESRRRWASRRQLDVRVVLIGEGEHELERPSAGIIHLKGNALRRADLIGAVALAGGMALRDEPDDAPGFEMDTLPAELASPGGNESGRRILVAEDNEINRKVICKQLALLGFTADIVADGREALAHTRRGTYALLLTDLHMPLMDGYELANAIRKDEAGGPRMPIIALTANALKGEARRCRENGLDDHMTKPVQLADLHAMLEAWMPAKSKPTALRRRIGDARLAARGDAGQSSTPPLPAVDLSVLVALVGNDPVVIDEMLDAFAHSAARSSAAIRQGVATATSKLIGDAAHSLKSGARSIGARRLGAICDDLEQAVDAGRAGELALQLEHFEIELGHVQRFLEAR